MPDIPAEDLPLVNPASPGYIVGIDSAENGVLYEAMPILAGRIRGLVGADTSLPPAAYEGYIFDFTDSASQTLTITSGADWPLYGKLYLLRSGTGAVTIAAGAGVTLVAAGRPKLRVQGSLGWLIKTGTDTFVLTGDTTA